MSLWARFKRNTRSFLGWFVDLAEDPELVLKQNIRDLEDQVPALNENIALIKANETLQRKEFDKLTREEAELTAKIKAALRQENRELALNFATTLEQVRNSLTDCKAQLELATASYEKSLKVKRAFLQEKERKVNAARSALNAQRKAAWQGKVADAMGSFSATGVNATHDDMIRQIEQSTAHSEARLEIALDTIDSSNFDIAAETKKLSANETLRQFELELGIPEPKGLEVAERKTIGPSEAAVSEAPLVSDSEKTIGPRERELA